MRRRDASIKKQRGEGARRQFKVCSKLIFALCAALPGWLEAQDLVSASAADRMNRIFETKQDGPRLHCSIEPRAPFLDFAFRFESGYVLRCPLNVFEGRDARMVILTRITPEGGAPLLLAASYKIPGLAPELREHTDLKRVKSEFGTSGVFALGEGRYMVELIAADNRDRVFEKKWKVTAARGREERSVEVAMRPASIAPLTPHLWSGGAASGGGGLRLTVLLNAAPIYPYSQKLRAWDRAFLLDSVSSVLRHLPCQSVRLVAFNLDQQREVFRQERLDGSGLMKLDRALRSLELGTISARVLEDQDGWSNLLAHVSNDEVTAGEPSDAVVFLGPSARLTGKVRKEILTAPKGSKPQFFYLEYFPVWRRGAEFPDSIHQLTNERGGTVLKIHNPSEFAGAIRKVLDRVRPAGDDRPPEEPELAR